MNPSHPKTCDLESRNLPASLASRIRLRYLEAPMEHPCYKCGATVEEGIAFCPHCNAPQIRVGVQASALSTTAPGSSPSEFSPDTVIQWPQALPAAAVAGLVAALLALVPLGGFGLGTLSAGFLAVLLYRRRNPGFNPSAGMGAKLGAVSGALAFAFLTVFLALWATVFRTTGQIRQTMIEAVEQSAARSSSPQQAQQALEFLKTPAGFVVMMVVGLVTMFVVFLIFSSVGGAIGAALLRRKGRL